VLRFNVTDGLVPGCQLAHQGNSGGFFWPMSLPRESEKAAVVEAMFDRIAARYDLMNRIMTFGMDRAWRRRAVSTLELTAGCVVVDLACGTGDLSMEAAKSGARVIGVDFAAKMLRRARTKAAGLDLVRADALRLPMREGCCDAVVSGFAVRNFVNLQSILMECARVLKAGGRIALLEVDTPPSRLLRAGHRIYLHKVVPLMGRLVDSDAYSYLPSSTAYLPKEGEMIEMMRAAGFEALNKQRLLGGAVQIVSGRRIARKTDNA
jgi:demethylmenaquinone methyltransferase / 2-methoxy-6-polyprenyl-1,4-benzoquinol methylase